MNNQESDHPSAIISENDKAGTQFDPQVVEMFSKLHTNGKFVII